jgi:hypothetical protein
MPKHRKSTAQDAHQTYVVAVMGWEFSWNFSTADLKREPGPYSEFATLTFLGELVYPSPFKYPKARVDLSGRKGLDQDDPVSAQSGLGTLRGHDDQLEAYLIVPVDRLAVLASAADRTRLVEFNGTKLYRRVGIIRGIHISTIFTAGDWQT